MSVQNNGVHWGPRSVAAWKVVLRRTLGDVVLANLSLLVTTCLLYGSPRFAEMGVVHLVAAIATMIGGYGCRLYRISARYMTARDMALPIIALALVALAVGFTYAAKVVVAPLAQPVTLPIIFYIISVAAWFASRSVIRAISERVGPAQTEKRSATRIIIIGAGDAGSLACRELQRLASKRPLIVGFVDDDPAKHAMVIYGVPVLGTVADLPMLVSKLKVDETLIAIPSASGPQMRRIWDACSVLGVKVRTLPSFEELISGKKPILGMARAVRVEDLLRRKPVEDLPVGELAYLNGQSVLISGGGGSIGSELARMVVRHDPSSLVLLGKGENSIFEVNQELRTLGHSMVAPVIADVRDVQAIRNAFERYRPTVVFHAAAHKHVPLMESVPIEAIMNNVFGTLNMAEAAVRQGCKKFILVSTDKAVNPGNVMGATKRVAEMIVAAMASRSETDFAAVRFGNVLGSRGSLIPILQKQIERGGPITITHPDMTRFFMTIPEAAQLIAQAGSLGSKGDIFILDMGESVRIMDIATDLVRLSGLEVGKDIEMKFIGIRPGEKMYEELSYSAEEVSACSVSKIMRVSTSQRIEWPWLKAQLDELQGYCRSNDSERARAALMDLAWGSTLPPDSVLKRHQEGQSVPFDLVD